jgi:predicted peptidase
MMKQRFKVYLKMIGIMLILYGGFMWAEDFPGTMGIYEKTFTLANGTLMRYTLCIPKSFSSQKEVPLIMALHFGGTVTPWYGKGYLTILVKPALGKLGAIIAAPDCPGRGWDNPTAESAVIALMNHIKQHYKINSKQVLLTGFSMGGIGTWYTAARHPELFSAAIPVSGMAEQETIDLFRDIPVYVIHSNADEIFPINPVEEMVQKLKSRGVPVTLEIVKGISHYHTADFVRPLQKTIPWIKQTWEKK